MDKLLLLTFGTDDGSNSGGRSINDRDNLRSNIYVPNNMIMVEFYARQG